jgi:hypothetical protein
MASLAQSDTGGYVPTVIEPMRFADSLRFHARLDVRSKDATSAMVMNALTRERSVKKLTPKQKISLVNTLIGG